MTQNSTAKKWNDEAVAALTNAAGTENPVSKATVESLATALSVPVRSVAAKLRHLGHAVASLAEVKAPRFSPEQSEALAAFVNANANQLTYKQISEQFQNGAFSAKEVQGKILAMDLTPLVKPAEKVEAARTYSEAEEATFVQMANAGKFLEEIATALNRELPSVRGKALSLTRSGQITKIPAQRETHAQAHEDPINALGDKLATMTVADIAKATDKTERGIRTTLTRRGIKVADYDGQQKKEKADGKRAVAA